ncbi:hypothetical protein LCM10_00230 [Rossellomorea aquimaris]|uniref:hypothetical protein n=1 Tax=Rossellomorea aquimaris TaxID=189382 RepID=UPI001CD75207|nr:hypothetical protein [Rossellomorea aquimaris]MCA1053391.1 hypothetical protein [Rossellomorea aquimaris]
MKKIICLMLMLMVVSGCKDDMPEPETFSFSHKAHAKESLSIKHIVQGNQVFIECIVPDVTFTSSRKGAKKGKIIVTSNTNGLYKEFYTAAFVVRNLPKGNHILTVEVVSPGNKSLGIKKQLYVTIP